LQELAGFLSIGYSGINFFVLCFLDQIGEGDCEKNSKALEAGEPKCGTGDESNFG